MERTPEPELMDDEAQARAYAGGDFSEPHDRCVALLKEKLAPLSRSGTALDLGCGPADVTIRFARAFTGWRVDGMDGSLPMLKLGRVAVEAAGLGGRITLSPGHLPESAGPRPQYDLVFANALLHQLADPAVLWQCIRRWAAPGGAAFVQDLARPPTVEAAERLVEAHAAREPEILRRDYVHSFLAAYRPDEVRAQLVQAGLEHFHVESIGDRHLIVWGRL